MPAKNLPILLVSTIIVLTNSIHESFALVNEFLNYTSIALVAPVYSASNVVEHTVSGQPEFMAVFYVIPGKYTTYVYEGIHKHYELVTVTCENMTEVDWR